MPTTIRRAAATISAALLSAAAIGTAADAATPLSVSITSTKASTVASAKALSVKVGGPAGAQADVSATVDSLYSKVRATAPIVKIVPSQNSQSLRLTTTGVALVKQCATIRVRVTATLGSSSVTALKTLTRSSSCTKANTAPTVATTTANRCEFIADGAQRCLLPYPNDWYTKADPTSATGRRVNINPESTIANNKGVKVDPAEWNRNDGFGPTPKIMVNLPGLVKSTDTREGLVQIATNSGWPTIGTIGTYSSPNATVVLVDKETGQRFPVWAELDSSVGSTARPILIHPAKALTSGRTYVVALAGVKTSSNALAPTPAAFKLYRDSVISSKSVIEGRRNSFEQMFDSLATAGVARSKVQLAWEFTVQSTASLTRRMLAIRDNAFAQLGDTNLADLVPSGSSPAFTITSVQNDVNTKIARRVEGRVTVPCYLTSVSGTPCAPGSTFNYSSSAPDATPVQNGTYQADFRCEIPRSAFSDRTHTGSAVAKPPVVYGHGLLGGRGEVGSDAQVDFADQYGYVYCATNEIGFASEDVPTAILALGDLSNFKKMADRTQQGILNELFLGRALVNSGGLRSNAAFQDGSGGSLLAGNRLYYDGNSQGGILGGLFTAVGVDHNRAVLGVNGMTYSTLLDRSVDFLTYLAIAYIPGYSASLDRSLGISMIQDLWDRAEPSGYVNRMTSNPLPNTPAHQVMMQVGLGDFQVHNITADTEARSIGAGIYAPIVDTGRGGPTNPGWNLPQVTSFPYSGSILVYFDSGPVRSDGGSGWLGNSPPIFANATPSKASAIAGNDGTDPHEHPRRSASGRAMKAAFLQENGVVIQGCGGKPCYGGGWTGP